MSKNIIIDKHFDKKMEKQYIKFPIDIPENTEQIDFTYSYDESDKIDYTKPEKNIIDFGLIDSNGNDLGTSGCSKSHITISSRFSTKGYMRIEPKGKWTVVFGTFSLKNNGANLHCEIFFKPKERKAYYGDTHVHTNNSDGVKTVDEICKLAHKNKLDFIIITDHNYATLNLPSYNDMTVIPGIELTHFKGHMNIWGIKKPYDGSYSFDKIEDLKKINDTAYNRGAVQSINHPYGYQFEWQWGFDNLRYDCVEVWNTLMRQDNLKAVEWWNKELNKGRKLPIVGGSDFHKRYAGLNLLGRPTTVVFSNSSSQDDILDAIKNGHSLIISSPKCPLLNITTDDNIVGDSVKWTEESTLRITVSELKRGQTLKVIDKTGIVYEMTAIKNHPVDFVLPVKNKGFIRAEIDYKLGFFNRIIHNKMLKKISPLELNNPVYNLIYSMTNPIYFE